MLSLVLSVEKTLMWYFYISNYGTRHSVFRGILALNLKLCKSELKKYRNQGAWVTGSLLVRVICRKFDGKRLSNRN